MDGRNHPASRSPTRQHPMTRNGLDDLEIHSSNTSKCNHAFITYIGATNVVSGLRRPPVCIRVTVKTDWSTTKTSSKPVLLHRNGAEWEEPILLPSERLSTICFKVYASFENGPERGNGVLLCRFQTTVQGLLDRDEELYPIRFLVQRDDDVLPRSILRVIVNQHNCDVNECLATFSLSMLNMTTQVIQLLDAGHRALLRYQQLQSQRDLDEAIAYFERARDTCTPDHPARFPVLFDLATAMFVHCQDNCHYHDLNVPVTLYHTALRLDPSNCPHRSVTALNLCFALLAYLQDRKMKPQNSNGRVVGIYAYRTAWVALQMAGVTMPNNLIRFEIPPMPSSDVDVEEMIRRGRATLLNMSLRDPRRADVLAKLGGLLCYRIEGGSGLEEIHEAISMLEHAIQLTSDGHSNKLTWLNHLGSLLFHRFERFGNLGDINKSILMFERGIRYFPDAHLDHLALLNNLGISLSRRFERLGDLADLNKSILMFEQAVRLTPSRHPDKASRLNNLGNSLASRFQRLGDLADINKAISVFEQANCLIPGGHPSKPGQLSNLGASLYCRFKRLDDLVDINKSVLMGEEAVHLAPTGHPYKPSWLTHLGTSLSLRFRRLGHVADINKSVLILEEAVRLTPDDHPSKQTRLDYLGISLCYRYEHLGGEADINRSISVLKEAVRLVPSDHPDKPARLNNLGSSLLSRFGSLGDIADIDKSISLQEEAIRLAPNGHPNKPAWLNSLGNSLLSRFERLGTTDDIDKSILVKERAMCLTPNDHADKPAWLDVLGSSLDCRFQRLGNLEDIHNSISMLEEAIRLTPKDHADRPTRLNHLGSSLTRRFERLGDLADIHRSVAMLEEAVYLTPDDYANKPVLLDNLGLSLLARFERLGDLTDINESISKLEEVVHLTPNNHPTKSARLSNLGSALFSRFGYLNDLADVEKSVATLEEAVHLIPVDHPQKPSHLSNLANCLSKRFQLLGDLTDVDKCVLLLEEADHLTPSDHPFKPSRLNNLANSLSRRFEHFDDPADIQKSILMLQDAVRLTPFGHADKPGRLNNLGMSLFQRFERLGDPADLKMSISVEQDAVRLTQEDHPEKLGKLLNLGNMFMKYYEHSHDPSNLSTAILHFSEASRASIGPVFIRFTAALRWIISTRLQGGSQAAIDAYTTALDLLPQLAWIGLSLAERHRLLYRSANVVRDAAAAALDAGCPDKAVEWLEQGRSIVWGQILQLRTPVDELSIDYPVLACQFQQISRELGRAGSLANDSTVGVRSLEREVRRHYDLALRREKLLEEIRSLPGFDQFLLPKTIKQLVSIAHSGPAVYLNVSERRCDALIVMAHLENAIAVPLPRVSLRELVWFTCLVHLSLTHERLISHGDISASVSSDDDRSLLRFLDSLLREDSSVEDGGRGARVKLPRISGYTPDQLFQATLAYLWNNIVHPVLESIGFLTPMSVSKKKNRIFWCPTGPFAFLPIHAAGIYNTDGTGAKLSDFAISSYIPSLSALAPQKDSHPSSHIRLLAVPQPQTDGLGALVCVKEEMDHLQALSAQSPFVTLEESPDGTVEDVLAKMKHADWVHFACHGVQDPKDPLSSGLCLADGRRLKLSDVIHLSRPQGGLAFLSACQTAQGDLKLSDESVHVAAGMLLAGYGSVVATMWAIRDPDAPKVTKNVYEHLFRDGKIPDSTEAAEALHNAVCCLRDSGASFTAWVPFIHVGR